jgi:hypothetical protein
MFEYSVYRIVLIITKSLDIVVHHHRFEGYGCSLVEIKDVFYIPVVFFSADQRVGADHQWDAVGFFPDLAFVDGPAEHVRGVDDLRKLVEAAFINQCSKGDCIVYVKIAVHAGLLSVAVPADKVKGAFMSCFPEVLFQLAAEVIGISEIIVVVNPDRGIVFHRKSLSLTILRFCHQHKEIFSEIQVSSMEQ